MLQELGFHKSAGLQAKIYRGLKKQKLLEYDLRTVKDLKKLVKLRKQSSHKLAKKHSSSPILNVSLTHTPRHVKNNWAQLSRQKNLNHIYVDAT